MMTDHYNFLLRVEILQAFGDGSHGSQHRSLDTGFIKLPGLPHVEQKRASGCRFLAAPQFGRGKFAHRSDVRSLEIEFLGFTSVDQCRYRRFEQAFLVPFLVADTGNQQRLHNGGGARNHKQPPTLIQQGVEAVV